MPGFFINQNCQIMTRNKHQPPPGASLNPRQKSVLSGIVQQFIKHPEPVSSKSLVEKAEVQASSATIRKVMSELESLGLIEQPYTSAGRQPTDLGYRTYLNQLIELEELTRQEKEIIQQELGNIHEENEVLKHTARLLCRLTNLMGLAVPPAIREGIFQNITLVPVADRKVMLILSFSETTIRTAMVEVDMDINPVRLDAITVRINERIGGRRIAEIDEELFQDLKLTESEQDFRTLRVFTDSILRLLNPQMEEDLEVAGTKNILMATDLESLQDVEGILELLDSKVTLIHFLRERNTHEGVYVTIGAENENGFLRSYSLITSTFNLGGNQGTIGIIGPKHIPYSKLISVVDYTAKSIDEKNLEK